jgi:predicted RNase H-like nuclease (RuvC/YqgF family)
MIPLAALFLTRQRAINHLRAENEMLQHQVESRKANCLADIHESPTAPVDRLSEADERELLQLRSKISPLRENLRDASNRVIFLQRLPTNR